MNGDIGKTTAVTNTAIYTTNQIDTTSAGIMGAPVGAVAIVPIQTTTNPVPQPPQTTEYALVNGTAATEMQQTGEYYSASDQNAGETTAGSSTSAAGGVNENGIPLDQLKQMLSAQLEYYFSR